jgi:hypothetical protein
VKGTVGWVFEGKVNGADRRRHLQHLLQINLHSFEATPTGVVVVVDSKASHTVAMFRGNSALSKAHRCMADVLDAIAELSSEANPEAFDVRAPVLTTYPDGSINVLIGGRVHDAIAAFSAYFGNALKDNVRIKHAAGGES